MTHAVCLHCGATKIGAWTPCAKCGRDIETPDDQARSLLLTDHNLSREELGEVAAKIRGGQKPVFDEAKIAEMAKEIAGATPGGGFLLLVFLVLGVLGAIGAAVLFGVIALIRWIF